MSVNGSSATGNCSSVTRFSNIGLSRCDAPTSSVLFDGNIPTLTGLDGDMWASQLLTLELITDQARREILFDFTGTSESFIVERVELVMFNCPEWRISVQTIRFFTAQSIVEGREAVATFPVPPITSCDSLVRICISQTIMQPVIALQFIPPPDSIWTHLAEVTFHGRGSTSPPATIITTPPPDTTTPPPDTTTPPPDTSGTTADSDFATTATSTTCKLRPFQNDIIF